MGYLGSQRRRDLNFKTFTPISPALRGTEVTSCQHPFGSEIQGANTPLTTGSGWENLNDHYSRSLGDPRGSLALTEAARRHFTQARRLVAEIAEVLHFLNDCILPKPKKPASYDISHQPSSWGAKVVCFRKPLRKPKQISISSAPLLREAIAYKLSGLNNFFLAFRIDSRTNRGGLVFRPKAAR